MSAATAIRDLIAPLLPGWSVQLGLWRDPGGATRSAVIRQAGGPPAELVRRPQFTLALIGLDGGDMQAVSDAADTLVEAIRADAGALVWLQAGEPIYFPTADGRPLFEIALSAIAT